MLEADRPPPVPEGRWESFGSGLARALDAVDREATAPRRPREARSVYGTTRRRALAAAGVCVAVAVFVLVAWPVGFFAGGGPGGSGVCAVESIETFAAGYTPMCFTSTDPELTVIWVFSDEVEPGLRGRGPAAE